MKRAMPWILAVVAFLLGCAASVGLWAWWTPRCNETCPPAVAAGMMVISLLLPLGCAFAGGVLGSAVKSRQRKTVTLLVLLALTVAVIVGLTVAAHMLPRSPSLSG